MLQPLTSKLGSSALADNFRPLTDQPRLITKLLSCPLLHSEKALFRANYPALPKGHGKQSTIMHKSSTTETSFSIGRGPYHCEICGRSYSRRDHLARHNQTHTSQRPFVCSECGKGFARRLVIRNVTSWTSRH